jgi:hypothetical protein
LKREIKREEIKKDYILEAPEEEENDDFFEHLQPLNQNVPVTRAQILN